MYKMFPEIEKGSERKTSRENSTTFFVVQDELEKSDARLNNLQLH